MQEQRFSERKIFDDKAMRIVMIGLSGSGKSTVLEKINLGKVETMVHVNNFAIECVRFKKSDLISFTLDTKHKFDKMQKFYFKNIDALILVVDSVDRNKFSSARSELKNVLEFNELQGIPLLVLANKQDQPKSSVVIQITEVLRLYHLRRRQWYIQGCSATQNDGIQEAFCWLGQTLDNRL